LHVNDIERTPYTLY